MKIKIKLLFYLVILLLLLSNFAFSMDLNFFHNDEKITNFILKYDCRNKTGTEYINNEANIDLENSEKCNFILNKPETMGVDYYTKKVPSKEINVFPAGNIKGSVFDEYENLIEGAELCFSCSNNIFTDFPLNTDSFGSFEIKGIPVGECEIKAKFKDEMGSSKIKIKEGEISESKIILDKGLKNGKNNFLFLTIIGIIIVLITFYFVIKYVKMPSRNLKKSPIKYSEDGEAIMKTLNEREKEVIGVILENNGKLSQAKIYYKTGIPKVSLSRLIKSLEMKGLIEVEKIGKVNNIKIKEFFIKNNMEQ